MDRESKTGTQPRVSDSALRGFTLVELMVVLSIVALLVALAIPGLASLGAFSKDEFRRAVNESTSLLRAAEIYARTYRVNTAVVYSMDHWNEIEAATVDGFPIPPAGNPEDEDPADPAVPIGNPLVDSVTGLPLRQLEAAALMYQLPSTTGVLSNRFVPVPGAEGEFKNLPNNMTILLINPEEESVLIPTTPAPLYYNDVRSNYRDDATINRMHNMGMAKVSVALGVPKGLDGNSFSDYVTGATSVVVETFPAHVFQPSGRLLAPSSGERSTFYVGPVATRPAEERMVDPTSTDFFLPNSTPNMLYRKIHVFKSTGRVEVPKHF